MIKILNGCINNTAINEGLIEVKKPSNYSRQVHLVSPSNNIHLNINNLTIINGTHMGLQRIKATDILALIELLQLKQTPKIRDEIASICCLNGSLFNFSS